MNNIKDQYLDGQYYAKNPSFHTEHSGWKAAHILNMLNAAGCRPRTVAEVGCGAGQILIELSKTMPETTFDGYELSPQGFELCRQRENTTVRYFNRDFADRVGPPYDLVMCIDVLEHIEDCFTFLRSLKQHGRSFLFHVPLDMNAQMVARNVPMTVRRSVGHLHYFCKDTAMAVLLECGYDVKSWFYTPAGVQNPTAKGRLLRIPRRLCFNLAPDATARVLGGYSLMVYATPEA